jgi:hypothetical protein
MSDEEWVEFKLNCFSLEYKHPSGFQMCLERPINNTRYEQCDKGNCPLLKSEDLLT